MDHELDDIGQRDSDDRPPEVETSCGKDVQTVSTGGTGTAFDTRVGTGWWRIITSASTLNIIGLSQSASTPAILK